VASFTCNNVLQILLILSVSATTGSNMMGNFTVYGNTNDITHGTPTRSACQYRQQSVLAYNVSETIAHADFRCETGGTSTTVCGLLCYCEERRLFNLVFHSLCVCVFLILRFYVYSINYAMQIYNIYTNKNVNLTTIMVYKDNW
jgi:hypothetical protein